MTSIRNGAANGFAGNSLELTAPAVAAAVGAWFGFLTGPNVMVAATNSNFLVVLPHALNVSRAAISGALAVSVWGVAILTPIVGRAMDRVGIRPVILSGIALLGLSFLLLGLMNDFWEFFALQVLLALTAAMAGSVGYAKLISLWFDRNRGIMLGLCVALGAGVGQTIMPKVSQWLIRAYGWRGGYIGIALIVLVIGFPAIAVLARAPRRHATAGDEACEAAHKATEEGMTRTEVLLEPAFYLIFLAIMLASMCLIGTLQFMVPMLLERGANISLATSILSVSFGGVVFGQFSIGYLADRMHTPRIVLPYFLSATVGLVIVHTVISPWLLVGGALLMGMGLGCEVGQNAYLVTRYFGIKSFGSIYGLTLGASNLGIGIGLVVMGWMRDVTGSYDIMRYIFGVGMLLSVFCVALLGPFRFAPPQRAAGRGSLAVDRISGSGVA